MSEFSETPTTPLSPTDVSSVISQATSVQTHHDPDPHQHRPHAYDYRHQHRHYPEEFEEERKMEKQILQYEHDQRHQEELEERKYRGGRKDPEDAEAGRHRVPRPGHRHHSSSPSQLLHHTFESDKSKPHPNPIDNDKDTETTNHSKSPEHHHKLRGEGRHKEKDNHHHPPQQQHQHHHGHSQEPSQEHESQHLQPPKKPPIDDETLIQDVKEFLHVHAKDIPHPETTNTNDLVPPPHHAHHHSHHPQHEKTKKEIVDEIVEKEFEKKLEEELPPGTTPTDRKPKVVHAKYKDAHTFHRHGRFHYRVPLGFVSTQETEMEEPGGELIVFHIPSHCHVGDELIIEY